ncbi:MAG: glycoside hydrolase family 10 protein, partial [Oscillospiraceae bacterium]
PQETSVRTAGVQTAASTAEEASAVTIQTESPPEITETTTVSTTASTTVSTTAETAAQPAFAVTQNSYTALNYKKQKGIWFSYLEYSSILMNKTASEFRTNIGKCFDNVKSLDFNTVYVQVRAFGDAYYDSELFPTGDRMNGTIGAKAAFDPLEIMIEEAHSRGLSVHAWINPMRLMTDSQIKTLSDSYTVKKWYNDSSKNGTYIVKCNDRWYLNPAYDEVKQLISDGITEIAANYDIDGIQIDDYFYPTTDSSFDSAAYKASGTDKNLAKWRTDSVNSMVKAMCKAVHSANPTAVFGISPQGSVDNNVNDLYADVKAWCKSAEYCDYILPQIYYGFENPALPYADTIALWSEMTSSGNVKLVIGLAGYKIGIVDNYAGSGKNEWINNSDMLARQIALAEKLGNYGGVAIFRYGSLFTPDSSVSKQVSKELENIKK